MKYKQYGFTIVELLIVIVVIAILATISIVAYNGIQNRTHDSVIQQDLANIAKQLEVYRITEGEYPRYDQFPENIKLTRDSADKASNNVYYITSLTSDAYALGVRSKSRNAFILANGTVTQRAGGVDSAATAAAAGLSWSGTDTSRRQGWSASNQQWDQTWNLTRD